MERIIWTHLSKEPFYVFDQKHVVHFWADGMSIHHANEYYKDIDTRLSPFGGPHIYPKALPREFYKSIVLNKRLPLSLTMEGDNLGTVKLTSDYVHGETEIEDYKRTIVGQQTKLALADNRLAFSLKVQTTPVDPRTAHGRLRKADKLPRAYAFKFAFPLDIVPELFDLSDSERRMFQRNGDRSRA